MGEERWVLLIASDVGGTESVFDRAMERLCDLDGLHYLLDLRITVHNLVNAQFSPELKGIPQGTR